MGTELLSACVFCASLVLGTDLPPLPGASAEISGAYATFERQHVLSGEQQEDVSDVTPKFVGVGMRWAWLPPGRLGAGTPAREVRVRLALAPSHDEQEQKRGLPEPRVRSTGTGRYENVALLYRQPFGAKDSLEAGLTRRTHKGTDLVNLGGENFEFGEQRVLNTERWDFALGWRRRFAGVEVAAAGRLTRAEGRNNTAGSFTQAKGRLYGGSLEGRARRGQWIASIAAERMEGDLDVHEESLPDFVSRDFQSRGRLEALSLSLGRTWGRTEVLLTATLDRSRLPFVAMAVLGSETRSLDAGYHPESRTRETIYDLSALRALSSGVRLRAFLRAVYGSETVSLTDRSGNLPPLHLTIRRGGDTGEGFQSLDYFGLPQFVVGLGLDFAVGRVGR